MKISRCSSRVCLGTIYTRFFSILRLFSTSAVWEAHASRHDGGRLIAPLNPLVPYCLWCSNGFKRNSMGCFWCQEVPASILLIVSIYTVSFSYGINWHAAKYVSTMGVAGGGDGGVKSPPLFEVGGIYYHLSRPLFDFINCIIYLIYSYNNNI